MSSTCAPFLTIIINIDPVLTSASLALASRAGDVGESSPIRCKCATIWDELIAVFMQTLLDKLHGDATC
jgi:hypothetical protein